MRWRGSHLYLIKGVTADWVSYVLFNSTELSVELGCLLCKLNIQLVHLCGVQTALVSCVIISVSPKQFPHLLKLLKGSLQSGFV